LEFCEATHPLLTSLLSTLKIGFMDDITLAGAKTTVEADVSTIQERSAEIGLQLSLQKCEVIMDDSTTIMKSSILNHFIKVRKEDMTLLGAPIFKGSAQDTVLKQKVEQLRKALERLSFVHSHDALVLLKNSVSMPKLLYFLRTSNCSDNPLLTTFDSTLKQGLSSVLNVDLTESQWFQASLPVRHGGLGWIVAASSSLLQWSHWARSMTLQPRFLVICVDELQKNQEKFEKATFYSSGYPC